MVVIAVSEPKLVSSDPCLVDPDCAFGGNPRASSLKPTGHTLGAEQSRPRAAEGRDRRVSDKCEEQRKAKKEKSSEEEESNEGGARKKEKAASRPPEQPMERGPERRRRKNHQRMEEERQSRS